LKVRFETPLGVPVEAELGALHARPILEKRRLVAEV